MSQHHELDYLDEKYQQFTSLSDNVELFWTLTSSSSSHSSNGGEENNNNYDTSKRSSIDIAVAYLLPNDPLLHEDDDANMMKTTSSSYWLAFGISEQGGMVGADMMIYIPQSSSSNNKHSLLDVHGTSYSYPTIDICGQDWAFVNASTIALPTTNNSPNDTDTDDVNNIENNNNELWHIIEVTRTLQSNDINEDLSFVNDDSSSLYNLPTHVLASWGRLNIDGSDNESNGRRRRRINEEDDGEEGSEDNQHVINMEDLTSILVPHGPSQRVSATVRFFDAAASDDDEQNEHPDSNNNDDKRDYLKDMPYIDLVPKIPFHIPNEETTYKNFCFTLQDYPELMSILSGEQYDQGVHIIAFHDILSPPQDGSSTSLVHHMDLHGTTNEVLSSDKRLCRVYMDLIHPWEAGSPRLFELPSEAGIPLGGKDGYAAFRVEVHYHNPRRLSGLIDQSGVRLYYTLKKRPNVAGLMLLGDYALKLRGSYTVGAARGKNSTTTTISNVAGGMRHSFYCPPSCFSKRRLGSSSEGFDNNVTVFREVFHMHKSGERMTNIQLGANGSIKRASEANYFDFSQGAGYASRVDLPYQINEGDSFVTTCFFTTRNVLWGSSSDDEMCQAFLWYYPKSEYSLSCSYFDGAESRLLPTDDDSSLGSRGCEMSYDRAQVAENTNLERTHPNEECEATGEFSTQSRFGSLTRATNLQSWPSLLRLVNMWNDKVSDDDVPELEGNSTTSIPKDIKAPPDTSSLSETVQPTDTACHLCLDGQRPTRPDVIIEGFSWTCEELDAAIPVLYTHPELLFFSSFDVPPCEKYRASFGELCGCPPARSTRLDTKFVTLMRDYHTIGVTGVFFLLSLMVILLRRRAS